MDKKSQLTQNRFFLNLVNSLHFFSSPEDLMVAVGMGLKLLQDRHEVRLFFLHDLEAEAACFLSKNEGSSLAEVLLRLECITSDQMQNALNLYQSSMSHSIIEILVDLGYVTYSKLDSLFGMQLESSVTESFGKIHRILVSAHANSNPHFQLSAGIESGLSKNSYLMTFEASIDALGQKPLKGGVYFEFTQDGSLPQVLSALEKDIKVLLEHWISSYGALLIKEQVSLEKLRRERTYFEHTQTIAGALQYVLNVEGILVLINDGLHFLEEKYSFKTRFVPDLDFSLRVLLSDNPSGDFGRALEKNNLINHEQLEEALKKQIQNPSKELKDILVESGSLSEDKMRREFGYQGGVLVGESLFKIIHALNVGHINGLPHLKPQKGNLLGLSESSFFILFDVALEGSEEKKTAKGGLYIEFSAPLEERIISAFTGDAVVLLESWRNSYRGFQMKEQIAQEKMLKEQMYLDRLRGIANMVTGVAHEINTPLGVASTSNSIIVALVKQIKDTVVAQQQDTQEIMNDLIESCELMSKNIKRAHQLVESFKKLSSGQLIDEKENIDLLRIINDCITSMSPATKMTKMVIRVACQGGIDFKWRGYPGHLSQVIVNFIQNTIRYGYSPDQTGGEVDIRVNEFSDSAGEPRFRIEYQDYGKGIAREVYSQMFQPFVTTGRSQGGTGLGMAISHNIVTNILKGKISCFSELGKGTTFTVEFPKVIP